MFLRRLVILAPIRECGRQSIVADVHGCIDDSIKSAWIRFVSAVVIWRVCGER